MLTATESELLNAAMGYISLNSWRVFPARSKRPLVKWKSQATRDPRLVKEWWGNKFPGAEISLAIPAGLLVVDVDPRANGVTPTGLPPTRTATTPQGGWHHYFSVPVDAAFVGHYGQGVDLKAGGKSYVLLPPTTGYAWVGTRRIAALPNDVLNDITRGPVARREVSVSGESRYLPWETATRYGEVALENQVKAVRQARNGERNNELFRATCAIARLVAGGELQEDYAMRALYDVALETGLDQLEVVRTMESAVPRGLAEPRRAN